MATKSFTLIPFPAFLFFFFLLPSSSADRQSPDELYFAGFRHAGANLSLNGAAEIEHNGLLRLTNDTRRVLGHAFYAKPLRLRSPGTGKAVSFSTAFAFAIVPEYPKLGSHGLAFVLSPSKALPRALPSQYLGLLNSTNVGNFSNHVVAVEFDTVQDFEFGDINDNHVGVDINSLASNASAPASFFDNDGVRRNLSLQTSEVIQAWIDYDSPEKKLTVKLSPSSAEPNSMSISRRISKTTCTSDSPPPPGCSRARITCSDGASRSPENRSRSI